MIHLLACLGLFFTAVAMDQPPVAQAQTILATKVSSIYAGILNMKQRVAWSHDGTYALTTTDEGMIYYWDLTSERVQPLCISMQRCKILRIIHNPVMPYAVSIAEDGLMLFWDFSNKAAISKKMLTPRPVQHKHVAWSSDGRWLACGLSDQNIYFVDYVHSKEFLEPRALSEPLLQIASSKPLADESLAEMHFIPNTHHLMVTNGSGRVDFYNCAEKVEPLYTMNCVVSVCNLFFKNEKEAMALVFMAHGSFGAIPWVHVNGKWSTRPAPIALGVNNIVDVCGHHDNKYILFESGAIALLSLEGLAVPIVRYPLAFMLVAATWNQQRNCGIILSVTGEMFIVTLKGITISSFLLGNNAHTFPSGDRVFVDTSVSISPDARHFLTHGPSGYVTLWRLPLLQYAS